MTFENQQKINEQIKYARKLSKKFTDEFREKFDGLTLMIRPKTEIIVGGATIEPIRIKNNKLSFYENNEIYSMSIESLDVSTIIDILGNVNDVLGFNE